jgi:hypothetical protein
VSFRDIFSENWRCGFLSLVLFGSDYEMQGMYVFVRFQKKIQLDIFTHVILSNNCFIK